MKGLTGEDAPFALRAARAFGRAGVLAPVNPLTALRVGGALRHWGKGLAGLVAANAARDGDRVCLLDELGSVTAAELHERSSALALALAGHGVGPGDGIGLLCRDHRYFVEAAAATAKLGADLLLLNTSFSGPQLQDVMTRESSRALIYDSEFEDLIAGAPDGTLRVVAWQDGSGSGHPTVDELIGSAPAGEPQPAAEPGRTVLLTSGTTGTPKGARRPPEAPTAAIVAVLERIPLRRDDRHFVAAPLFHAWGFAHLGLGMLLGSQVVLRRRFDAEQTLAAIARHRVTSVAMVPVMAQRILGLPEAVRDRHDVSHLRLMALGGSAIPGDLAVRLMDEFGDVVYNSYGSSEVAIVSIATPQDLRADPATAGRPVSGIELRLVDADGREVPQGQPGRIFVGSDAAFEGYTGGQTKESLEGLMSSGDLGSLDAAGRLRIEGRDDDMIVSGGENVYPREVEDVIGAMPGVLEAAVIGVDDPEFGQRLKAFVVPDGHDAPNAKTVKQVVRDRLARYKVPRDVVFLDELPRNATGKVLKRELA